MTQQIFSSNQRARAFLATARRFPNVYAAASDILLDLCPRHVPSFAREETGGVLGGFLAISSDLVNFRPNDRLSLLYALLLDAQSGFAVSDCFLPCQEDGLTSLLKKRIVDTAERMNANSSPDGSAPLLYVADLNVRGRERRTGADIAFIVQLDDGFVVHCFQAKRADVPRLEPINVRRGKEKDNDGGNQLRRLARLSELGIVSSYLFYNNGFEDLTFEPAVPIAKNIAHILLAEENALDVFLDSDCTDLATYVTRWAAGSVGDPFVFDFASVGEAINVLVGEDVTHIVAVCGDYDRYELLLRLAAERGLECAEPPTLSVRDIDVQAVIHTQPVEWLPREINAEEIAAMSFG
ncbi:MULTISPECIES: hypothetical protein [Agrobacterium]|uniref:hypothetical protein n=1 Tax=Agrobacterium TaxID=357 RepID=UPI00201B7C32|nr:hypothetical protein [Agrobacterium rubi]MCL6654818.1 hypothetical protein [Agrobacterium rubi]